jgi:hypothetical protein
LQDAESRRSAGRKHRINRIRRPRSPGKKGTGIAAACAQAYFATARIALDPSTSVASHYRPSSGCRDLRADPRDPFSVEAITGITLVGV